MPQSGRDPAIIIFILESGSDIPSIIDISKRWGDGMSAAYGIPTFSI
jgi:hypothetical protein